MLLEGFGEIDYRDGFAGNAEGNAHGANGFFVDATFPNGRAVPALRNGEFGFEETVCQLCGNRFFYSRFESSMFPKHAFAAPFVECDGNRTWAIVVRKVIVLGCTKHVVVDVVRFLKVSQTRKTAEAVWFIIMERATGIDPAL